jgi:hypothetical protein
MGLIPSNQVFRRELQLSCDLLFGAPTPNKEQPTASFAVNLVYYIHNIHSYDPKYL